MFVAPFGVVDDGTVTSVLRTESFIVVRCAGNLHGVQVPSTWSVLSLALHALSAEDCYGIVMPTLEVVRFGLAVIAIGIASLVCSVLSLEGVTLPTVFETAKGRWLWHTSIIARVSRSTRRVT